MHETREPSAEDPGRDSGTGAEAVTDTETDAGTRAVHADAPADGTAADGTTDDGTVDIVRRMIEASVATKAPDRAVAPHHPDRARRADAPVGAPPVMPPATTPAATHAKAVTAPAKGGGAASPEPMIHHRDDLPDLAPAGVLADEDNRRPARRPWARWRLPSRPGWWQVQAAAAGAEIGRFLRRPDAPRQIAIAALVVFVAFWPWFILVMIVLVLATAAISWFTLGPDRASELIVAWYRRLEKRDPQEAETLRRRAAAASRWLTAMAARLPERWTAGLYLPDFEPDAGAPAELQDDPFDRLASEVRGGERAAP